MSSISDIIEQYLIQMIREAPSGILQVKRSELADLFQCVPSQINYVISTRFTVEKGYVVESKRGGGGYIRLCKVQTPSTGDYYELLQELIGLEISQSAAEDLLYRLIEEGWMTLREAGLVRKMVSRDVLDLPLRLRDQVRARMMRSVVTTLFANKGE
ncbi:CtsR family transcriptional regulator [Marininema halotolerans]|uniref:Transcriptional regulator CtsR n=1 Tax=Marininema halotolerans TaxID=1155944 RepID=A0A1I6T8J9_9BACL|nr:CtsR family transcriptional regulator [Marininema halotolerans]SFS85549.1 transcriptional regulator CtsR [Marininema halotolerans]